MTPIDLNPIAIQLRALNLYAFEAHHQASGASFFGDHEALSGFYEAHQDSLDEVIELSIAIGQPVNEIIVIQKGMEISNAMPRGDSGNRFAVIHGMESALRDLIAKALEGAAPHGIQAALQDMHRDSLRRSYKIGRRIN